MPIPLPFLIMAIVIFVYFHQHEDPTERAVFLRKCGLVLMGLLTFFVGAFIIGETVSDPGGVLAIGLIAVWLVPLIGLLALAWWRPDTATTVLGIITGLVVAVSLWSALTADTWSSFEDDHGPIRSIGVFAVCVPLALLGWKRPKAAGIMLLVVTITPLLASLAAWGGATALLGIFGSPAIITAALYLASVRLGGEPAKGENHDSPTVTLGS